MGKGGDDTLFATRQGPVSFKASRGRTFAVVESLESVSRLVTLRASRGDRGTRLLDPRLQVDVDDVRSARSRGSPHCGDAACAWTAAGLQLCIKKCS